MIFAMIAEHSTENPIVPDAENHRPLALHGVKVGFIHAPNAECEGESFQHDRAEKCGEPLERCGG